jgi:hypothetical protein
VTPAAAESGPVLFVKIAGVYLLATLPFAWQLSDRLPLPDALLWGLRAPFDVLMHLSRGVPVGLVPLGLFIFILFIGLTVVWATESSRQ